MKSMTRWLICLVALFCAAQAVTAQTNAQPNLPIRATVCQLENHPGMYDRKLVQTEGHIYFGKFDFVIDADCEPHSQARVWLDFGGDILSPSEYWGIGNFLPKQKGVDVRVKEITIPAVGDSLMDKFVNDVAATRFRKPNGDPCGPECLFYEVSATVTGMFLSGARGGFGMEECCHLLVIEKVAAVSSKRTSVPAGGEYECTSDRWRPTPEELKALSAIPGCSLRANFRGCYAVLAKHWGDSIKPNAGLHVDGPWTSRDMTRYYKFIGGFISKPGQRDSAGNPSWNSEMTPSSSVTREVCHATVPPRPTSDYISCSFYRSGALENKDSAIALQKSVNSGNEEVWRSADMARVGWLAYEDAEKKWKLTAPSEIKLEKCQPWPAGKDGEGNEQQWGYCTWLTKDDMEEITVQMHKPGYLRGPADAGDLERVAWIPTEVEVNLCRTTPTPH
jgi:hypothetical protein